MSPENSSLKRKILHGKIRALGFEIPNSYLTRQGNLSLRAYSQLDEIQADLLHQTILGPGLIGQNWLAKEITQLLPGVRRVGDVLDYSAIYYDKLYKPEQDPEIRRKIVLEHLSTLGVRGMVTIFIGEILEKHFRWFSPEQETNMADFIFPTKRDFSFAGLEWFSQDLLIQSNPSNKFYRLLKQYTNHEIKIDILLDSINRTIYFIKTDFISLYRDQDYQGVFEELISQIREDSKKRFTPFLKMFK